MERIRFQRTKQSLSNSAVKTKARKNIKTEGKKVKRKVRPNIVRIKRFRLVRHEFEAQKIRFRRVLRGGPGDKANENHRKTIKSWEKKILRSSGNFWRRKRPGSREGRGPEYFENRAANQNQHRQPEEADGKGEGRGENIRKRKDNTQRQVRKGDRRERNAGGQAREAEKAQRGHDRPVGQGRGVKRNEDEAGEEPRSE